MLHAILLLSLVAAPTDVELTAFGEAMAADFSAGRDGVTPRFDFDAFMARALPGEVISAQQRASFAKGFEGNFSRTWGALAAESAAGTHFSYRRNVLLDGLRGVQLRVLYKDDGGFNFVEFAVAKNARGELRVVDLLDLSLGSLRSADVRLMVVPLLKRERSVIERLLGKDAVLSKDLLTLKKMNEALLLGRPGDAVSLWTSLPETVQNHRVAQFSYLTALSQLDDPAAYAKASVRFLELFPEDPSAEVRALEIAVARKDFATTLRALDSLERRVGEDASFALFRSQVKRATGAPGEARQLLEHAVALEPKLPHPWRRLIELGLEQRKWADVAKWMTAAEAQAGLTFELGSEPFAAFARSAEGKAWAKAHSK